MKILGIFRGFPGLGRVVSGTAILETLRDEHNCTIDVISYLQGKRFLERRGYNCDYPVSNLDYCSIGLLPTNKMGAYIHDKIKVFEPDIVILDGEPLILQSLRISYPKLKIVILLNPSDVDNPQNDSEAMAFFNSMYCQADLAIIHGLRKVTLDSRYNSMLSIGTILRKEIFQIVNIPSNDIYCVLGGGTVNVGDSFSDSTIKIAQLCINSAIYLKEYKMHIICSSPNIYDALSSCVPDNVIIHKDIVDANTYYTNASLIITRSGRNTLSELAYLGIPAISFISGCTYRRAEQEQNLLNLKVNNISSADLSLDIMDFVELCRKQINSRASNPIFSVGNKIAIEKILSL